MPVRCFASGDAGLGRGRMVPGAKCMAVQEFGKRTEERMGVSFEGLRWSAVVS